MPLVGGGLPAVLIRPKSASPSLSSTSASPAANRSTLTLG